MNIKTVDLRRFKDLASHIRRQKNLDIDSFVRFGGGVIAKNAYESCIKFDCQDSDEDFLIHEDDLYPLVSQTPSETISITKTKKGVIVSDGRDKFPALTTEFQQFLEMPDIPAKTSDIDAEFLSVLKKAYPICAADENQGKAFYNYVHIGNNTMCVGDGIVAFMHPIPHDIKLALPRKEAAVISSYKFDGYSETEGFYFFYASGFIMGFRRSDIQYTDIRFVFDCKTPRTFTYSSDDLKSFNLLFIKRSKFPVCTFVKGGLDAYDMYVSEKTQKRDSELITVTEEFSFSPEKTNLIIDSMGVDALDFYQSANMCHIKSVDTPAISVILKMSK